MGIQDSTNNLKDQKDDVAAGDGKGNGEGLGNETQAQQDAIAKQIAQLQAQAAQLTGADYDVEQARLKIEKQIQALQLKEDANR